MPPKHSFRKVTRQYARSIEALGKLLPPMMFGLNETVEKQYEERAALLEKHATAVETGESEAKYYNIEAGHEERLRQLDWILEDFLTTSELLPATFLVTAVSQYDAYLGSLIKEIIGVRPEILTNTDKKFSYSDVDKYKDISEFQEHYIEILVESILRQSHSEQFKWLEGKLGVSLTSGLDVWPKFIELTQRRHLFVHSAGRVSAQYLEVCKQNSVDLGDDVRRNTRLAVPPKYYLESIHVLQEIGIKLGQVAWRKLLPDEERAADSAAIDITYDLICRKDYLLASKLLSFFLSGMPRVSTDSEGYMTMKFNLAQCYKWLGNNAQCIALIEEYNTRIINDKYALVVHVLRDDYSQAADCVRAIGKQSDMITASVYRVWPIFQEFRKSTEFKTAYRDVYGEEYIDNLVEDKAEDKPLVEDADVIEDHK